MKIGAVVTALFFANAAPAAEKCTKRQLRSKQTESITLRGTDIREHPAFYFRDKVTDTVLYFAPEDVVRALEKKDSETGSRRDSFARVLTQVRADLPLKENSDLLRYGLGNGEFASMLEYFVADLLDAGRGSVDTPPHGDQSDAADSIAIARVYWHTRGGDGRHYCDASGRLLLTLVDSITD